MRRFDFFFFKFEVDVIDDVDEYQTLPGRLALALRLLAVAAFLASLRETVGRHGGDRGKEVVEGGGGGTVQLLLHFGAASLVWFSYLPLAALVSWRISPLWRGKFMAGVVAGADAFAHAVVVHLLWPGRAGQYATLAAKEDPGAELADLMMADSSDGGGGGASTNDEDDDEDGGAPSDGGGGRDRVPLLPAVSNGGRRRPFPLRYPGKVISNGSSTVASAGNRAAASASAFETMELVDLVNGSDQFVNP